MTTNTAANPFLSSRELYGKQEPYTNVAKLAQALAAQWEGATLGECEEGPYGIGRVVLGDLVVVLRADTRKLGRVSVYSGAPSITRHTGAIYGVQWPEANVDSGRPFEKLAADIKRRVVDQSAEALTAAQEKLTAYRGHHAGMTAAAETFKATFPTAEMDVPSDVTKWEARFRIQEGTRYITGRIGASGGITLDHFPTIPADKAAAVFALLYGEA